MRDRCPTSCGPYRCDKARNHVGECETLEVAAPWAGPARAGRRPSPNAPSPAISTGAVQASSIEPAGAPALTPAEAS